MDEATLRRRRWLALGVLCVSLLTITLDNTILNVAVPALVKDLDAGTSQLQWIIDGYVLVFAGLLLTAGSLGDRFGRKGALQLGLVLFSIGSVASAVAGTANHLIFTRAFMGIGAALIMPATLSLLTNIFPDPRERGRAIGVWAAVAGGAGALGPLVGGALLEHFWWGSVFLVNVPVTVIALLAGRKLLPTSRDPAAPRLDPLGAIASVASLVVLLWGVIEAPTKGWTDPAVLGAFGLGALLMALFITWELRSRHPMLDVRFFANPRFSAANGAITMVFFAMMGSMFLTTQYLQTVLGFSSLQAGVRMLPMAMVMMTVAPLAPRLVERVGTKLVVGGGLLIATSGLAWMSRVPVTDGYPHMVSAMVLMSIGMGLTMAPATESIMGSLPRAKAGVGSAMNDTTRQVGGALGVAIIGSLLATSYRSGVTRQLQGLGLPADVVGQARESVGGAVGVADTLPASLGRAVAAAGRAEFVQGLSLAILVAAAVTLGAALVVFVFLPARGSEPTGDEQPIEARDPREDLLAEVPDEVGALAGLAFADAGGAMVDLGPAAAEGQDSA